MPPPVFVTPGFAPVRLIEDCFRRLYSSGDLSGGEHWFLHNHYPLNDALAEAKLFGLCAKYGVRWYDSGGDHGCHESLNRWAAAVGGEWPDDQTVITLDPDASPRPAGWADAIRRALAPGGLAVCALWVPAMDRHLAGDHREFTIDGLRVVTLPQPEMQHTVGWRWGAVKKAGGWTEPHRYYGGIEAAMWPRWEGQGLRVAYLRDFADDYGPHGYSADYFDPEFRAWKDAHLTGDSRSFAEWLSGQGVKPLTFCRVCGNAELSPLWGAWHRCRVCGCESNAAFTAGYAPEPAVEDLRADADWFASHKAKWCDGTTLVLDSGRGAMLEVMQARGWSVHGFDERPACELGPHVTVAPLFHAGLFPRRYSAVYDRGGLSRTPGWRQRLAELALSCLGPPKFGLVQLHAPRPQAGPDPAAYHAGHAQLFVPGVLRDELADVGLSVLEQRLTPGGCGFVCRYKP